MMDDRSTTSPTVTFNAPPPGTISTTDQLAWEVERLLVGPEGYDLGQVESWAVMWVDTNFHRPPKPVYVPPQPKKHRLERAQFGAQRAIRRPGYRGGR